MDLLQLRYFVTIAETQSLSKAGERLCIAQPALSRQLAALEDELSTKLFERRARGVTLTPNGEVLLRHANLILKSVKSAVVELKIQDASVAGRVTVGLPCTVAKILTTAIIREVHRRYPNVLLNVVESSVRRLVPQLERGEVDLAILVNELERHSLDVSPVATEEFCLFGLAENSDGSAVIDWAGISRLPMLLSSVQNTSREFIDQAARANGVRLQPVAELDASHLLKDAVRAGLGYAILPRSTCGLHEAGTFWLRSIEKPTLQTVIAVAASKVIAPSPAREAVKLAIMDACRSLVAEGVWAPLAAGQEPP